MDSLPDLEGVGMAMVEIEASSAGIVATANAFTPECWEFRNAESDGSIAIVHHRAGLGDCTTPELWDVWPIARLVILIVDAHAGDTDAASAAMYQQSAALARVHGLDAATQAKSAKA